MFVILGRNCLHILRHSMIECEPQRQLRQDCSRNLPWRVFLVLIRACAIADIACMSASSSSPPSSLSASQQSQTHDSKFHSKAFAAMLLYTSELFLVLPRAHAHSLFGHLSWSIEPKHSNTHEARKPNVSACKCSM